MNTIYIILLILLTVVLNVVITWSTPLVKNKWYAFISDIKRKLNAPSKTELRLQEFDKQINTLTKRVMKVNEGNRELIRKVVREYLEELKTK